MQAARREAREILLAFMMGAEPALGGTSIKRGSSGAAQNQILYKARSWVLADSELATVAVATPPLPAEPKAYVEEYQLLTKGPRSGAGKNTDTAGLQLKQGFGLRTPDDDSTAGSGPLDIDTRTALKPIMTVVFVPSNDMLHAFRAGPTFAPSNTPANNRSCPVPVATAAPPANCEYGGEELWGFVPYDQLLGLGLRTKTEAAGTEASSRDEHVYMMAGSIRFSDVFVPGAVSFEGYQSTVGVWRRVMFVGRGIGGKYLTALDVTGTGPYTLKAARHGRTDPAVEPGQPGRPVAGPSEGRNQRRRPRDKTAYEKMGETWSLPVVAYVNRGTAAARSTRRPAGPARTGPSSSCSWARATATTPVAPRTARPAKGRTFFTLDALSGDVIAAADVGARPRASLPRTRSSPTRPGSTRRPTSRSRACTRPSTS